MGVVRALEIERLKPVADGVYVCKDAEKGEFELIPLEMVNITINGKRQPLGVLLFSLVESHNKLINLLMTNNNNTEVK